MSAKNGRKRNYLIAAVIVVFCVGAYVFYRMKKKAFLDHQLQEMVQKKTNQLYTIHYDSIRVDEIGGNVYIQNLHIKGDTARQLEMLQRGDTNAVKLILDAFIPELKIEAFKTAGALLNSKLVCKRVIISNPRVTIYLFPGVKKNDTRKQQQEFYKQILGNLKLIKADSISILNSEVVATDFYTKENKFHAFNTSVNLSGVAIDSTYNEDTTRTLFCKEINITSDKIKLGDRSNTAELSRLSFDTRSGVTSISEFDYDGFKNKGFFKSKLEGINLKGVAWSGPIENTDLSIESIVLEKGEIETLAGKSVAKANAVAKPILTGWINSFALNSFQLKSLVYVAKPVDKKAKTFEVKNNLIDIKNFAIDRSSYLNESLIRMAKEVEMSNDEITLTSEDNDYTYQFTGLRLNSLSKKISAKSIRIIPKLGEAAFAEKAHYQRDRYNVTFNNLECKGVDIERLLKGEIRIADITTTNNSVYIFHDLSYPIDSAWRLRTLFNYPHRLLHKTTFPLWINNFAIRNTTIEYKEKSPKSESSGKVRFTKTDITINNISNSLPKPGEKTYVHFSGNFLEAIPVTANLIFYEDQWKKGKFSLDAATHKSFDASILNQLTQPMSLAQLDNGTISSFKINITADTTVSKGTVDLQYKDLKISLLKKKGNEYNKKGVFSFIANILVKNNNDPTKARTANVEVKPNKFKSFFNYIWMSIFTGAKQILLLKL